MPRDEARSDQLSDFEKQLQSLPPFAAIDRDRLMFRAGQSSVKCGGTSPRRWWLLGTTNAFSALAAGLLVAATLQSESRVVERLVERPALPDRATEARPDGTDTEFGYFALRNRAIKEDWRAPLAAATSSGWEKAGAAPSYRQLLEQYSQELR